MPIQISYLADHPEWIAAVGHWYQQEWENVWEPKTFSGWWDVSCEHANYSSLPIAFVAHQNGDLLGAVGLDPFIFVPELNQFDGLWMTALFADQARSQDVKAMLVRQVLETAKHFGHRHVYTMCRVSDGNYNFEGRSWERKERTILCGREIFILSMTIG
ncbi:hypothetical protein [Cerasicoccus arenae]|uniref:N-acetyltransferase domain-containing protein n=1 Tax=Cerasicoccus arenae TaxID=424488 RepID=A0A8J3DGV2_9BACT|nr:hypothetical protein [Cerasicoccus arenae]MBK1857713.1 hypothetical protein [Cerasicoccus arenae]GHB91218.1 hypothetical protein GCM10007047_02790 [Cerasicoccus arenae]